MTEIIQYDYSKLKTDIAILPEKMLEAADEEISQACDNMVGYAKIFVRVDTGSLRDSIRKERGGIGENWRRWRVRAGGYIINPKTKQFVNYAGIVESRYPFMAPAFDMIRADLTALIKRRVVEAIKNE